jgi:hypothetical protein
MKTRFAQASLILFGVSLLLLVALTLFESALINVAPATERLLTFLLLVVPAALGAACALMSLRRREGRTALAVAGVVLNSLFALFHLMIVLLAG